MPYDSTLRPDGFRVEIRRENAEHTVNARQIARVLVELPLQLIDCASKLGTLRAQVRDEVIPGVVPG
jgi:hypothetical protein